jgi:hypothetical protein
MIWPQLDRRRPATGAHRRQRTATRSTSRDLLITSALHKKSNRSLEETVSNLDYLGFLFEVSSKLEFSHFDFLCKAHHLLPSTYMP